MKYLVKLILRISPALAAGEIVVNPEKWKTRANLVAALGVLIGVVDLALLAFGFDVGLSEKDQITIATAAAILMGLFFPIANTVSTKKIGLKVKNENNDSGSSDDFGPDGVPSFESGFGEMSHSSVNSGADGLRGGL